MKAFENPALTLRSRLRAAYPGAMVRWDESGRALCVTDAPRRGMETPGAETVNGLAYFDLPREAYESLRLPDVQVGRFAPGWFQEQATLAMILSDGGAAQGAQDESMRGALSAAARGEKQVRAQIAALRPLWARAKREKDARACAICRAAARILACWLRENAGAGVPLP